MEIIETDSKLNARFSWLYGRLERNRTAARNAGVERNAIDVGYRAAMAIIGPRYEHMLKDKC